MSILEDRNWRGLETVEVGHIKSYLEQQGYQRIPYSNRHGDKIQLFKRPNEDGIVTLVLDSKFSDFFARLADAIDRIAEIENEPTYVVLQRFVRR